MDARDPQKTGPEETETGAPVAGPGRKAPVRRRAAAWGVHVFTASGIIAALFALLALVEGNATGTFLWLGLALLIDGLDGPLARRTAVALVVPRIDGAVLDLVIDYVTYVLIPALFVYQFGLAPEGWGAAAAGFILATSLYTFANRDMKTADNYFEGFPAVWNLVVFLLYLIAMPAWANGLAILCFGALTFTRLTFVHPFRVRELRRVNVAVAAAWGALALYLLLARGGFLTLDSPLWPAVAGFVLTSLYFVAVSAWRSVRGRHL